MRASRTFAPSRPRSNHTRSAQRWRRSCRRGRRRCQGRRRRRRQRCRRGSPRTRRCRHTRRMPRTRRPSHAAMPPTRRSNHTRRCRRTRRSHHTRRCRRTRRSLTRGCAHVDAGGTAAGASIAGYIDGGYIEGGTFDAGHVDADANALPASHAVCGSGTRGRDRRLAALRSATRTGQRPSAGGGDGRFGPRRRAPRCAVIAERHRSASTPRWSWSGPVRCRNPSTRRGQWMPALAGAPGDEFEPGVELGVALGSRSSRAGQRDAEGRGRVSVPDDAGDADGVHRRRQVQGRRYFVEIANPDSATRPPRVPRTRDRALARRR